jgi:hypothetical protein
VGRVGLGLHGWIGIFLFISFEEHPIFIILQKIANSYLKKASQNLQAPSLSPINI